MVFFRCESLTLENTMQGPSVSAGDVFGRLTVESRDDFRAVCACSCGSIGVSVRIYALLYGQTRSCGCLKRESDSKRTTARNMAAATHRMGNGKDIAYSSWNQMIQRCFNELNTSYPKYGEKGITVCLFLREDPRNLVSAIGPRKSTDYSLDRFPDNSANYSCGSCEECKRNGWDKNIRWATRREQARNMDSNRNLTAFGKTMLFVEWQELSGIDTECLRKRMQRGWTLERALTTPDTNGRCLRDP